MSKGDHVFNNIVAKLYKTFSAGLLELRAARAASSSAQVWTNPRSPQDAWLQQLPRTREALDHFRNHPDLVALRNQLQTSDYLGGDVNNSAYSSASLQFESAVKLFFRQLAMMRAAQQSNALLPLIAAVRRTFYHMAQAAEDPNARTRLLAQYKDQPGERAKVEAQLLQVQKSLDWAWARCEYLFRMVAQETLALPR